MNSITAQTSVAGLMPPSSKRSRPWTEPLKAIPPPKAYEENSDSESDSSDSMSAEDTTPAPAKNNGSAKKGKAAKAKAPPPASESDSDSESSSSEEEPPAKKAAAANEDEEDNKDGEDEDEIGRSTVEVASQCPSEANGEVAHHATLPNQKWLESSQGECNAFIPSTLLISF